MGGLSKAMHTQCPISKQYILNVVNIFNVSTVNTTTVSNTIILLCHTHTYTSIYIWALWSLLNLRVSEGNVAAPLTRQTRDVISRMIIGATRNHLGHNQCLQAGYRLKSLVILKIPFSSGHRAKISIPVNHKEEREEPAGVFIGHCLGAGPNVFF